MHINDRFKTVLGFYKLRDHHLLLDNYQSNDGLEVNAFLDDLYSLRILEYVEFGKEYRPFFYIGSKRIHQKDRIPTLLKLTTKGVQWAEESFLEITVASSLLVPHKQETKLLAMK